MLMAKGGSIRKLQNGKWQWVGYYKDSQGKIHRPTKSFNTKRAAEQYKDLQGKESKHIQNIINRTDYTVQEFFDLWKKQTKWETEEYYKFTTTNNWQYMFKKHIFPYLGTEKLQNIDYSKLQEYFNRREVSRKTYSNILQAIKSMLQYAKTLDENYVIVDNLQKVKITATKQNKVKVFNILSEANYNDIIGYMSDNNLYYTQLIILLHETGLRIEEALALTWDDVNFDKTNLTVTKAIKRMNVPDQKSKDGQIKTKLALSKYLKSESAYRSVPMTKYACRAIEAQRQLLESQKIDSIFLFPTKKGNLGDSRNVLRAFHSAINMCNKSRSEENYIPKRGLHSLRKMYCKRLRDKAHLDWEIIANIMGHSDISVTKQYYYSVSEDDMVLIAQHLDSIDARLEEERITEMTTGADVGGVVVVDGIEYDLGSIVFVDEEE